MSDFMQSVTEAFRSLLSRGLLNVESSGYDAQAFGNAFVTLAGQNLRVRMIRDRGDILAEAASSLRPDDWFPLQRVVRAVGVASAPAEGLLTPQQAADMVERYFPELDRGFGRGHIDHTRTALAELERFATKRLMDRVKRNTP